MNSRFSAALLSACLLASSALIAATTSATSAAPTTFSYTGPAVPIPDSDGSASGGPMASAPLEVSGLTGLVSKVALRIDGDACSADISSTSVGIAHTFVDDLQIWLTAPNGESVLVMDRAGGSGNNLCQTVFDDAAALPIEIVDSNQAPFTGTFAPSTALSALNGSAASGTWTLSAKDFLSGDIGNIRKFSLLIETEPATDVTGTMTAASGDFAAGETVTFTTVLSNPGFRQLDNPGSEYTNVLPAGLTLVSATASSGTAVATAATNTVTWDGPINTSGSVTITTAAKINASAAGSEVSNQGTIAFDADNNGTNEAMNLTDDPTKPGAEDPTTIQVASATKVTGTLQVAGGSAPGDTVTYTTVLSNGGFRQLDNAGDEYPNTLPTGLSLVSATASSGTAVATAASSKVTWNGPVSDAGVTITTVATIDDDAAGKTLSNQGTIAFDANNDGTNEASALTDDPAVTGTDSPTVLVVDAEDETVPPGDPDDGDDKSDEESGSAAGRDESASPEDDAALPDTGGPSMSLLAFGVALVGAGTASLTLRGRGRARHRA